MSVKGGCGKSTLSFYSGLYLSGKFNKRVYYIDTDLLASTAKKTIFGDDKNNKLSKFSMSDIAINGLLDFDNTYQAFHDNYVTDYDLNEKKLGLILCDSTEEKREFFRGENKSVNTAIYKGNLQKLFNKVSEYDLDPVCVIDMPPATDNYSDCLVKLMLEKPLNDNKVIVCHVTTDNYAHIVDSVKYIEEFYSYEESRKIPNKIILMVNVMSMSNDEYNSNVESLNTTLASIIKANLTNISIIEHLCIVTVKRDDDYLKTLSISNTPVKDISLKGFHEEKGAELNYSNIFISFDDHGIIYKDYDEEKYYSFYQIITE